MLLTLETQRVLDAVCRTDFVAFTQKAFQILSPTALFRMSFQIEALAYHLELVRRGKIRRLIINFPPRSLKSMMTSVAWPAFVLGNEPSKHIVVVSYGTDLAIKLTNDFRMVINSPSYKQLFPLMQPGVKNTEMEVITAQNGYRFATSIDGGLMGRGGDFLIIDDPLKPADALNDVRRSYVNTWFTNTLLTRMDDMTKGAIIVVMQRLHEDDLTGALLRSSKDWVHLSLPALAEVDLPVPIGPDRIHLFRSGDLLHPERMPRAELDAFQALDPETFAAHYQQNPLPPGGLIIQRSWLRFYDVLPPRNASPSFVLQSWDTASKIGGGNDWSVCTTWLIQDGKYFLIHILRERLDYPSLRERVIAHARAHQTNKIVVEDSGIGTGIIQELYKARLPVVAVRPERNKKTRMQLQSAKFRDGLVYLPRQAPGLASYVSELLAFPNVRFDDQVDSTSQALACAPSTYNLDAMNRGMGGLISGLAFQRMFG